MAGLLEQAGSAGLGLRTSWAACCCASCSSLARLALRGVEHLGALPLALLPVAVDVALALLEIALAPGHLFLGAPELRGGGGLRVTLDRVGELRGGADHVESVHPDGVPGRLDLSASGGLEDAQLHLELRRVTTESFEGLVDLLAVEPVRRLGRSSTRGSEVSAGACDALLGLHLPFRCLASWTRCLEHQYDCWIGP